jgi:hypothetical protein
MQCCSNSSLARRRVNMIASHALQLEKTANQSFRLTQQKVKLTTRVTTPLFLNVSENPYELLGISLCSFISTKFNDLIYFG